jgi:hypothetical protein
MRSHPLFGVGKERQLEYSYAGRIERLREQTSILRIAFLDGFFDLCHRAPRDAPECARKPVVLPVCRMAVLSALSDITVSRSIRRVRAFQFKARFPPFWARRNQPMPPSACIVSPARRRAPVSLFRLIADDMRQRGLYDFTREVGNVADPIPKAGAKPGMSV